MIPAVSATENESEAPVQPTRGAALGASKTYEADEWVEVGDGATLISKMGNGSGVNASANAGKVMGIRLTDDITLTSTTKGMKTTGTLLYIGYYNSDDTKLRAQDVILDLNGKTLKTDETVTLSRLFGTYGTSTFTIINGTLIMDGTYTNYAPLCFFNKVNHFTMDGVSLTFKDESDRTSYGGLLSTANKGASFTIINSDVTMESGSVYRGGMINTSNSGITITLKNSTFTGGKVGGVSGTTTYQARGGQFYVASGSTLTAENCTFTGGESASSDPATYESQGGNIFGYGTAQLTLTDCTVADGQATAGGNIGLSEGAKLTLDGTTVSGGKATTSGGNIWALVATINMDDSTITAGDVTNEDGTLVYGGNLSLDGGEDEEGCVLNMNSGTISDGSVRGNSPSSGSYIGGGNIKAANGATLNLKGGTISGGTVFNVDNTNGLVCGGSVYVVLHATVNLEAGATITGGNADSNKGGGARGGNIGYSGSTVYIRGTVSGGEADRGGNLFSPTTSSKLYIYKGSIIENGRARSSYGGNMNFNGYCYMYGGIIRGGYGYTADGQDIYVTSHASAKFYMYGGTVMGAKKAIYKGANSTTCMIYSGTFAENPKAAYIVTDCSIAPTAPEADGLYHVYHKDVEGSTTVVEATCTESGTKTIKCLGCGSNSTTARTYTYTLPATGHTAGEAVIENEVAGSCTAEGSYDTVVYCTVCEAEVSRETTTVAAEGHTAGEPVIENEVTGSCTADGSYDTVVYCTVCEAEVSRETTTVAAEGHTAGEPVIENEVTGSCTADGSYDTVVYCTVCTAEISRETTTVAATGHTDVIDAAVPPTCENTGLTEGKHCDICGTVIVAQETVDALGHAYESTYTAATFEADAYTTYVCANCGDTYVEVAEGTKLTAVATADGVPYETLQEALNAGGTVVLEQDITATEKLVVSGTVALDLNGCILTLAKTEDYALVIKGELTILDGGAIVAPGAYGIGVSTTGKLTVNGGNFFGTEINDYLIGNWGEVTINDGFFWGVYNVLNTFAEGSGTATITGGQFMTDDTDYTGNWESETILGINTTITGGQFTQLTEGYVAPNYAYIATGEVVRLAEVIADDIVTLESDVTMTEKLTVTGTTILDLNGYTLTLADVDNYGLVVLGNLTIVGEGTIVAPGTFGIGVNQSGYLTIQDGTYIAGAYNDYIVGNYGITVIKDGTFRGTYNCVNNFEGITKIYGGTYTTAATDWSGEYESEALLAENGMIVYGGTFSTAVAAEFCAEGLCPKANADGTYTVTAKAGITTEAASVEAKVGETVTFTVEAQGEGLTYKWEYSRGNGVWYNTKMEGVNTATLIVPVLLSRDGYQYRCTVTDMYGNSATSQAATLTVVIENQATIIVDAADQAAIAGETAIFTVEAQGEGLRYQWQYTKNGATWYETGMEGAKTSQLSVTATLARNGYQYRCIITDANGIQVVSSAAKLTVTKNTITTSGPADQVAVGGKAVFTVIVGGEGLSFRWQYQRAGGTKWFDTAMEGYNTNELTVTATAARNGYQYRCIITDSFGNETVSETATLIVE